MKADGKLTRMGMKVGETKMAFKTQPKNITQFQTVVVPANNGFSLITIGLDGEDNTVWQLDQDGDWRPWGSKLEKPKGGAGNPFGKGGNSNKTMDKNLPFTKK